MSNSDHKLRRSQKTVDEILDRFVEEEFPKFKEHTRKNYRIQFRPIRKYFGDRIAAELSIEDFAGFMGGTQNKATRDKAISVMSSAFSRAVQDWGWLNSNVCREVARLAVAKPSRDLEEAEIQAFRSFATPAVRVAIDLALYTGQRQAQLLSLQWSQVLGESIEFATPRSKKPVRVEISPLVRSVLDYAKSQSPNSSHVISPRYGSAKTPGAGYTPDGFRAIWQRVMRRFIAAGGRRFDFHDLRTKAVKGYSSPIPADVLHALSLANESLEVEHKDWLNIAEPSVRATLARHIAALSNFGGGYIVFGRTNTGEVSQASPSDLSLYTRDTFSAITRKYLSPAVQCEVFDVTPAASGGRQIVVRVPSHGRTPICSIANGPNDERHKPQGIVAAMHYIRAPGPESARIASAYQWGPIIQRCVIHERGRLLQEIQRVLTAPVTVPNIT